MIRWLGRRSWGKFAVLFLGSWYDWRVWTGYLFGTKSPDNIRMLADGWGWLSAAMVVHWARLLDPAQDLLEALKNLFSEWCRLDPERAGKVMGFLVGWTCIISLLVGIGIGALI